jgi:purine-binding chemotaxis protein CheW
MSESELQSVSEGPVTEWVTFHLDDEKYGINVMQVREVLRETEIAPVPGTPDYVLGIINLRGNVVTVIDTRKRFGLAPKEVDEATRIVIIEVGDEVVGMQVDSVAEVMDVPAAEIETAPNVGNDESAKYIQGVSNQNGGLLIFVDLNKLFATEEWQEAAAG